MGTAGKFSLRSVRRSLPLAMAVNLVASAVLFAPGCSQRTTLSQGTATETQRGAEADRDVTVTDEELGPPEKQATKPKNELSDRSNEQLIDALAEIDKPALGIHPTAWARGFLASGENAEFGGGILGSEKPTVVPAMAELVRRGVGALPALLAHLDDKRSTKLKVTAFAGVASHDAEYSPRDEKRMPKGVRGSGLGEFDRSVDEYAVKVGDVCFVLVGQIVNRPLSAVRYQPSGCLVINSPVATPALATAARSDWDKLTSEEHRRLLFAEAKGGSDAALARLSFYYPQTAERLKARLPHPR